MRTEVFYTGKEDPFIISESGIVWNSYGNRVNPNRKGEVALPWFGRQRNINVKSLIEYVFNNGETP